MADSIINKVIYGSIGLAVLFLLLPNLILPFFNESYSYEVTGMSSGMLTGIMTLVLILSLIGFAVYYIPKIGKK